MIKHFLINTEKRSCFRLFFFIITLVVFVLLMPQGIARTMANTTTKNGFVIQSGKTYYYKNGKKVKGLQSIDGAKYFFSSRGVMSKKKFQTIKKKKYYFGKNGKAYTGLKKIGKYRYYFDQNGVMQKGWQTIAAKTYYFSSSGKAITNKYKKIDNVYAYFDADSVYQAASSYCIVGMRRMSAQYMTDPVVKDETLLAAILYAEAGGETQKPVSAINGEKEYTLYKGQLAVAYTILNRLESRSYPNTLKEVIYQQYQFEPSRTGVLTTLLKNPSRVSQTCKQTAKIVLRDYKKHTQSIEAYPRSEFAWKNFWAKGYAKNNTDFFQIYTKKEYEILDNHVFFNYTKTTHSR